MNPVPSIIFPGGMIRTLSVSLLAVAAVVAGVMINRSRQPDSVPELEPDRGVADSVELEELRAAGF